MTNPNQYSPEEIAILEAKAEETRQLQFELWEAEEDDYEEPEREYLQQEYYEGDW